MSKETKWVLKSSKMGLGVIMKDVITGFEGTATAHCTYLNGCERYEISPYGLHDGQAIDSMWVDVGQIAVDETAKPFKEKSESDTGNYNLGGPQNTPSGMNTPR